MVPLSGRSNLDGWYLLYENTKIVSAALWRIFSFNKTEPSNRKKGFLTS